VLSAQQHPGELPAQMHDYLKQLEEAGGEADMRNVAPYITSKFARLKDITLSRMIGQPSTKFSFEEIMDQGKIFLVKLGKGRFGSITSALLANMSVGRFKLAAMKRSEMPASLGHDFFSMWTRPITCRLTISWNCSLKPENTGLDFFRDAVDSQPIFHLQQPEVFPAPWQEFAPLCPNPLWQPVR
jgi:hypothetical protein